MDTESQIQTLMEMGFPREQAISALEATGHDPNKAIAYLFGELEDPKDQGTENAPIEIDPEPKNQDQYDTVDVNMPSDLPDFLGQYASSDSASYSQPPTRGGPPAVPSAPRPQVADFTQQSTEFIEVGKYSEPMSSDDDDGVGSNRFRDYSSDSNSDSSEGSLPNIKTEGHLVPQLRKKIPGYRYWVPILAALCQNKQFADTVLSVSGDEVTPFVEELQKIVNFVQDFRRSSQWYILVDDLLRNTSPNAVEDALSPEEELITNIYKELIDAIPELSHVLNSHVESIEEEISNDLSVLELDSDIRKQSLYLSLNEQFWGQSFEKLGLVKYRSVAPVVTIHLMDDDDTSQRPLFAKELFYPEIYSDKALKAVQDEVASAQQAEHERRVISRNLLDLNFFEGKRLGNLLSQASEMLKPYQEEAGEDLQRLGDDVEALRIEQVERQTRAQSTIHGVQKSMTDFAKIIDQVPSLNKYRLQGVIMSDRWYYFRQRDTWVKMEDAELIDFEQVESEIFDCTRMGSQPVTLLYVNAEDEPDWSDYEEIESSDEDAIVIGSESEEESAIKLTDDKNEEEKVKPKDSKGSDDKEVLIDLTDS
ncbi:hypothetical protein FT663_02021 [Candidozyma haemuli var. vulneris]|nr:hypothetical protein FT662_01464 [[Candida] haemuloni var. vulneris]KAF3993190.1 hypothetical protein FT663_02021 [[Candida] haemuloni var. vulneris]